LDTPLAFPEFVLPAGSYCVLSIQDNGVGIAPSDQPRIFEPFFTKKTMGTSGTGLGMAVVRTTVLDHRGWIHLSSRPGEGTTFTIYLPATHEPLPRRKKAATLAELRGRNESVLVVDDSPEQREIASDVLHRLGYEVATVATGEDAIEYLRHQPMDLLMLNMIMDPGIDGLETYRRVLQFRPGQRAIIVSGFSETDRVVEARRLGAGAFLKKPYTAERLVSVIRSELDRRTN
ncbi:MAG TPA: response regulator, partial [Candidatus Aminicenantes bacterium]|nr:response regulator [Candidatus Aminicenantes bacterium]